MRDDIIEKKDEILQMISEHEPKSRICEFLNCKPATLSSYLIKLDIKYKGNPGLKGKIKSTNETSYKTYTENGKQINAHRLKLKLIKQGVKEKKCEICGRYEWNNKDIPLELHHINGNHFDNNLDNLQILCPNCHAQQETNSGLNIGTKINNKLKDIINEPILLDRRIKKIKKENSLKAVKKYFCIVCGSEVKTDSKTGKCQKCFHDTQRRVERPTKDELLVLIKQNSFLSLSKMFGVSDKAIAKWCIFYNLPYKRKDIKNL